MPDITVHIRPNCCDGVQEIGALSVYLRSVSEVAVSADEELEFVWAIRTAEDAGSDYTAQSWMAVKYCPFCGAELPELEVVNPIGPVCVCSDGGDYCDTCSERIMTCQCHLPEVLRKPKGAPDLTPIVRVIDVDCEGVLFRSCYNEQGEPFIPDEMQHEVEQLGLGLDRRVQLVIMTFAKATFKFDKPLDENSKMQPEDVLWYWGRTHPQGIPVKR